MAYLEVGPDGIVYLATREEFKTPFLLNGEKLRRGPNGDRFVYTESEFGRLRKIGAATPACIIKNVKGYDPYDKKKVDKKFSELLAVGDNGLIYISSQLRKCGPGEKPFPVEDTDFLTEL